MKGVGSENLRYSSDEVNLKEKEVGRDEWWN